MPAVLLPPSLFEAVPAGLSIDAIFEAFDGRTFDHDGARRQLAVQGVHDDGCCKWVQLLVEGPAPKLVTVRLCDLPEIGPALISKVA